MQGLIKVFTVIAGVALSPLALAGHYYDYAKVTKVEPVYEIVRTSSPERSCYRVREKHYHHDPAPSIVGAVIGGVIGHAIGDNRHTRRIGTVAGATIGASIGHNVSHKNAYSGYHTTKHCEVTHFIEKKTKQLSGYNVQYRYKGKLHQTFMHSYPGERIKLKVKVSPVNR